MPNNLLLFVQATKSVTTTGLANARRLAGRYRHINFYPKFA